MATTNLDHFLVHRSSTALPFTVLGVAGLAALAAARQVNYSKLMYAAVGMGSFVLGKASYIGECRRRLLESGSNSEFVQMLRKKHQPCT